MFIIRSRVTTTAVQVLRRQQRSLLKPDSGLSCLAYRGRHCAAVCRLHTLQQPLQASSNGAAACALPDTSFTQLAFKKTCQSSSNDEQQRAADDSQARSPQPRQLRSRPRHTALFAVGAIQQPLQARGLCSLSSARFRSGVSAAAAASRQQPNNASSTFASHSLQRRSMQTQRGGGLPPPLPPWQRLLFNLLGFTVICVGATLVFTFGSKWTLIIIITITCYRINLYECLWISPVSVRDS
jgi:hypothetical protein